MIFCFFFPLHALIKKDLVLEKGKKNCENVDHGLCSRTSTMSGDDADWDPLSLKRLLFSCHPLGQDFFFLQMMMRGERGANRRGK